MVSASSLSLTRAAYLLVVSASLSWLPTSVGLLVLKQPSSVAFPRARRSRSPKSCCSGCSCSSTRPSHLFLSSDDKRGNDNDIISREGDETPQKSSKSLASRRIFFQQQLLAASSMALFPTYTIAATDISSSTMDNGYFSLRNNNNVSPYAQQQLIASQQKIQQKERADRRKRAATPLRMKKWTPFVNVNKWNSVEKCLLEMLPVRNPVFRQLQDLIEDLEIFPAGDADGWKQTLLDAVAIRNVLDSKRSSLEPVFNQEDPTELYISKSSLGERNIEAVRSILDELIEIASGDIDLDVDGGGRATVNVGTDRVKGGRKRAASKQTENQNNNIDDIDFEAAGNIDVDAFIATRRRALFALAELGELLVPSFPYAVPSRGKFGYLPRLLGRCIVTLSFERPSSPTSAFGFGGKQFLGNVTIVADGYAAPITAGNFVDLCVRNFYNGLSVKAMRKRLGVVPTTSDNVIMNDLTELKDNLDQFTDSALELPEALKNDAKSGRGMRNVFGKKQSEDIFTESIYDENRLTMDAVLPILGSFQEGFYDPLTAKPRRIPLEIVTLDGTSKGKSVLTYSSSYGILDDERSSTTKYSALASASSAQRSYSSATSSSSSNSTAAAYSNLDPVLSYNIPDIVALNHPDRVTNGGSSEFFALPRRDVSSRRAKLLDGQYAPFGYIVSGSDVYQSLRPGDVIGATYVSDVGLLNLVKIRKNAFEGGEDDVVIEEGTNSET